MMVMGEERKLEQLKELVKALFVVLLMLLLISGCTAWGIYEGGGNLDSELVKCVTVCADDTYIESRAACYESCGQTLVEEELREVQ